MERLFSPSTRYQDIAESHGRLEEFRARPLQELNLDVSIEELVSAERAFTYGDLYAMLGNEDTVAWLTPHAFVARQDNRVKYSWPFRLCINADDDEGIVALAGSQEHLMEICDVVLRLLAASDVHSVSVERWSCPGAGDVSINAPAMASLLEQCQSLETLELKNLPLDENHCRVLGDYSRPGLEIELSNWRFTDAGTIALVDVLRRSQGPTKLDRCYADYSVLADGLRGNSRLKSFRPRIYSTIDVGKRELLPIASALKENRGLVELNLSYGCFRENDETWSVICDALKTHPTLEVLNLSSSLTVAAKIPAVITSRMQALLDMVKINLSIHTIRLKDHYSRQELFQGWVIPYLETNRLRPRLLAIQKTRPIAYRAKVLGRALLAAHTNANSLWMLLSGNAEVAFPSRTTTIAAAANLPTPATTAATSAANVAAVAAIAPTTGAASTLIVSAIDIVTTPTVDKKRKARPSSRHGLVD
jgi:hypothetical protein